MVIILTVVGQDLLMIKFSQNCLSCSEHRLSGYCNETNLDYNTVFPDQRKNLKWRISLYFHSSFSPISGPCGAFINPYLS